MSKSLMAITTLACAGAIAVAYAGLPGRVPPSLPNSAGRANAAQPVILELYQSQGCSSCPPALAVLNSVADRTDVLALNFAVTYWDQLGWKDSFAQPAFTNRQWEYARAGGRANVQTPQLIVDGRTAILGSRKNEVDAAIANHRNASGTPAISNAGNDVTISGGKAANIAKIWLVEYDPRTIAVPIRAGENSGRTLPHRNVVRRITALGTWSGKTSTVTLPPEQAGLARAILVQSGAGGPIIAGRKI